MADPEQRAFITLSDGSDAHAAIYSLSWEVPADREALERFAAILTEAFGAPAESISDETDTPGRPNLLFYGDSRPG